MTNVFELGILNWGFDLAARLLDVGDVLLWLTNRVQFGLAAVVTYDTASGHWEMIPNAVETHGAHFPYGREVEPP